MKRRNRSRHGPPLELSTLSEESFCCRRIAPEPALSRRLRFTGLAVGAAALTTWQSHAADHVAHRVLTVGPGATFDDPSAAAAVAQTGDVIEIAAGDYNDCAVWPAEAGSLTIKAKGNGPVVMTGKVCEQKAAFVIKGDDITVRGITFTGANSPFHNGAGIRAEGRNLMIENDQFVNNEEGILAAPRNGSTIVIRDSYFRGNGNCISPAGCAHGVYINKIDLLHVENCTFIEQRIGHHIKSRADRTELIGNTIEDGPTGTSSYLVDIPNGGALVMRRNILEKGPRSDNSMAAVILGEEGNTNVSPELIIESNSFTNDMRQPTVFVRNLTGTAAVLRENVLAGHVLPLEENRTVR